jgi:hypothetical protein
MTDECGHTAQEHEAAIIAFNDQHRAGFAKWLKGVNTVSDETLGLVIEAVAQFVDRTETVDLDDQATLDAVCGWDTDTVTVAAWLAGNVASGVHLTPEEVLKQWVDRGRPVVGAVLYRWVRSDPMQPVEMATMHRVLCTFTDVEMLCLVDEAASTLRMLGFTGDTLRAILG